MRDRSAMALNKSLNASKKRPTASKAKDVLIAAVNHHCWADICCWYRSARRNGFSGRVILICYEDTSKATIRRCQKEGIEIVRNDLNGSVIVQRWSDIRGIAVTLPERTRIVTCDVRDVAFQNSIENFLDLALKHSTIALFGEAWTYQDSTWNYNDLTNNFPDEAVRLAPTEVVCAGVIAATRESYIEFADDVLRTVARARTRNSDQTGVNLVIQEWLRSQKRLSVFGPDDALCVHFAVCAEESIAVFRQKGLSEPPQYDFDQGLAVTSDGRPFSVFHQYTKNPSVRRDVLRRNGCLRTFYLGKSIDALKKRLPWVKKATPYWMKPEIVNPSEASRGETS